MRIFLFQIIYYKLRFYNSQFSESLSFFIHIIRGMCVFFRIKQILSVIIQCAERGDEMSLPYKLEIKHLLR